MTGVGVRRVGVRICWMRVWVCRVVGVAADADVFFSFRYKLKTSKKKKTTN